MVERTTKRCWRIGELADATGLTVRTLHHYEHIGLLAPATRTEGRQRLYDEHDVRRLYRIRALRDLGLSLADIGRMLDDDGAALGDVLRAPLARVDAELERLGRLRALLDHACAHADRLVEPDDALAAIEAMSRVARHIDSRVTSGRALHSAEARWRELASELRACMEAGDDPSAPRARAAARTALALLLDFAGDDPATLDALACLRQLAPPKNLAGWDPALIQYLDQALAKLQETEHEPC
jgi:DNA-binding transcriptional MerR regulator